MSNAFISEGAGSGQRGRCLGFFGPTGAAGRLPAPSLGLRLLAANVHAFRRGAGALGVAAAVRV
ncbi:MAG TPA: hypothetical protein VFE31_10265 [Opitutaceae bacterium]|nr:hypothetical protein [Opitutaceae bacterium]